MNQLAAQLRKWVQGTEDVSQISDESKLCCYKNILVK